MRAIESIVPSYPDTFKLFLEMGEDPAIAINLLEKGAIQWFFTPLISTENFFWKYLTSDLTVRSRSFSALQKAVAVISMPVALLVMTRVGFELLKKQRVIDSTKTSNPIEAASSPLTTRNWVKIGSATACSKCHAASVNFGNLSLKSGISKVTDGSSGSVLLTVGKKTYKLGINALSPLCAQLVISKKNSSHQQLYFDEQFKDGNYEIFLDSETEKLSFNWQGEHC